MERVQFIPSEAMPQYQGMMFVTDNPDRDDWDRGDSKVMIVFLEHGYYMVTREKAIQLMRDFPSNFSCERDLVRLEAIRDKRMMTLAINNARRMAKQDHENAATENPDCLDLDRLLDEMDTVGRIRWVLKKLGVPYGSAMIGANSAFLPPPDDYDQQRWQCELMESIPVDYEDTGVSLTMT